MTSNLYLKKLHDRPGHPTKDCESMDNAKMCEDRCISDGQICFENCEADCNICQRDFFSCIDGND